MRPTTSASNLHRRSLCNGSERLEHGLPESESAEASEGRLLHEYDASPSLSRSALKPELRDLLAISARLSQQVFAATAETFGLAADEPFEDVREKTMWLHRGIRAVLSGTCDERRWYPRKKVLCVVDKKFGRREVIAASSNLQLRAYAVMAAELHPCEAVVVAITQPRMSYDNRVTMASYSPESLAAARAEIYSILDACKAPDAPLNPTEEGCLYCKAKLICPAYRQQLVPLQEEPLPVVSACDDDALDWLAWVVERAESISDQVHDEIRARKAADPSRMPGYTLGREGTMRTIADPVAAYTLLVGSGKLTREEYLICAKPALGKIEDRLRDKEDCTAKEARERLNALLDGVVETIPKKAALTRVSWVGSWFGEDALTTEATQNGALSRVKAHIDGTEPLEPANRRSDTSL